MRMSVQHRSAERQGLGGPSFPSRGSYLSLCCCHSRWTLGKKRGGQRTFSFDEHATQRLQATPHTHSTKSSLLTEPQPSWLGNGSCSHGLPGQLMKWWYEPSARQHSQKDHHGASGKNTLQLGCRLLRDITAHSLGR